MKYGLSIEQLSLIKKIIAGYGEIEEAILFGSRAIDTYKEASDVDIAIKGANVNLSTVAKLKDQLEEKTYIPFFFDIIAYNTIKSEELIKHINTKGIVIYRKAISEWKEYKLDDVASINPTESISKGKLAKKVAMEVLQPFTKKVYSYSIEPYNGGMKFRNGDTIVARITPCLENGKTAYIDFLDDDEIGFGSTEYIVLRGKENISDKHFLYYFSISSAFREVAILSMTGSSGRQRVQTDVVREHTFLLPSLPEQKAIASVLSSLDDKIDLLHRQNKTLEALAETLFRQWFVEEADESWEVSTIGENLTTILGGTPSTTKPEYWDGNIPWINSGEVNNFRILNGTKFITDLGLKKSNTKLLPIGTTVLAITGATLGQVSLLEIETCANQSVVGILPNEILSKEFIFLWIKHKIKEIILSETGGAQPHINKNDINDTEIILPDSEALTKVSIHIKPIFDKITNNSFQIRTLEKLRDTLLPKLMSGEIRLNLD